MTTDAANPLACMCYLMSEPHLSGYRLILGFETSEELTAAMVAVANIADGVLTPHTSPSDTHSALSRSNQDSSSSRDHAPTDCFALEAAARALLSKLSGAGNYLVTGKFTVYASREELEPLFESLETALSSAKQFESEGSRDELNPSNQGGEGKGAWVLTEDVVRRAYRIFMHDAEFPCSASAMREAIESAASPSPPGAVDREWRAIADPLGCPMPGACSCPTQTQTPENIARSICRGMWPDHAEMYERNGDVRWNDCLRAARALLTTPEK